MNKTNTKRESNSNGASRRPRRSRKVRPAQPREGGKGTSRGDAATSHRNIEPVRRNRPEPERPVLRFGPDAWAKLLWLRDRGATEVGGFGITDPDDPLRVIEFMTVRQHCTAASVSFEDEAVADFFEDQLDLGRRPEQVGRIWLHSHPGASAHPSALDEATFARVFGVCDWAVMFILAKGGATYARLRCNVGPGIDKRLPVRVDYTPPFGAADADAWEAEYQAHIQTMPDEMFDAFGDLDETETDPLLSDRAFGASGASGGGGWLDQFAIDDEVMALLGGDEQDIEAAASAEAPLEAHDDHDGKEDA